MMVYSGFVFLLMFLGFLFIIILDLRAFVGTG